MIQSELLNSLPGIEHGFGTREDDLAQVWRAKQVHSDHIIFLSPDDETGASESIEADAIITRRPGQAIGIQTADCVPILIAALDNGLIAAVHAGWRGSEKSILAKVVDRLIEEGVAAENIYAAIGPCISKKNYEVGEEVSQFFGGGTHIDLAAINRQQLIDAGVLPDHINVMGLCTFDHADLFYSYRRDGAKTGRNISWIKQLPQQ